MAWTVYVHDLVDRSRVAEIPMLRGTFDLIHQERGTRFDLELPLTHHTSTPAVWEPWARSVALDRDGELVAYGILTSTEVNANEYTLRVSGSSLWEWWRRRWLRSRLGMTYATGTAPIEAIWTAVDQFRIVSDLIVHASTVAAGAAVPLDGITYHSASAPLSGVTRSKTVYGYERKMIASMVEELSAQEFGFEFGIVPQWDYSTEPPTPRCYLHLWYPRRGLSASTVTLQHGGNVTVTRVVRDGQRMANPVTGVGAGSADAQITAEASDLSYLAPAGPYPHLDGEVQFRDWGVEYAGNVTRFTRAELALSRQPITTVSVVAVEHGGLRFGDVSLGDTVPISAAVGGWSIDEPLRVMAQKLSFDDLGLSSWGVDLAPEDVTLGIL